MGLIFTLIFALGSLWGLYQAPPGSFFYYLESWAKPEEKKQHASLEQLSHTVDDAELAPFFDPLDALVDPFDRISREFKVPAELEKRVEFWFKIYTQYGATDHVIHHVRYPWVIFKVVHTKETLNGPGHYWTKYHKARSQVQKEKTSGYGFP